MTDQAVVLGAGIAGLLAATALAEKFPHVTLVERDRLPDSPIDRRGAPQGRHLHSLLSRGWQTIDELLPGMLAELVREGATIIDDANMARIYVRNGRHQFNRTDAVADPAALVTYLASRPFIEFHIRRRIAALPNVSLLDNHDVGELHSDRSDRITAVTVSDRSTGNIQTLQARLIVDATGRAARTSASVERLGYGTPPQRTFAANGVYYSQRIAIPHQDRFAERIILVLPEGGVSRGGLIACENDTWTLTIAQQMGKDDSPPTSFDDMRSLADDFLPRHIAPALATAVPLTEVSTYRYPGGVWHRYDLMQRHPQGILAVGDALCCLNPINGQGMTMAALHARALREHLRDNDSVDPQTFYRSTADLIAPVWAANQPADRAAPRRSRKALKQSGMRWTRRKFLEAAEHDIVVTERLNRIANLIDPPRRLLEPQLLGRVAAFHLGLSAAARGR
jgi:2-polyprenyl-6-methoxyphenol hydroxylase-like FAD-dependent oxidoreductase